MSVSNNTASESIAGINNSDGRPLLMRRSGNRGGGGTRITAYGRRMIDTDSLFERERPHFPAVAGIGSRDFDGWDQPFRRMSMKVSTRNQLFGRVSSITLGAVNDEIEIRLQGEDTVHAVISHGGVTNLGLGAGSEVFVLINASWIMVTTAGTNLRLSARNRLPGTVAQINEGAVNSDVLITLKGGNTLAANITKESVKHLGINVGTTVCAVFKASSVILGLPA